MVMALHKAKAKVVLTLQAEGRNFLLNLIDYMAMMIKKSFPPDIYHLDEFAQHNGIIEIFMKRRRRRPEEQGEREKCQSHKRLCE